MLYLGLLPADAVFVHSGAKGAGVETKEYCRPVCSINSPTGFLEHPEDVVVFQLGQGFDLLPSRFLCFSERIEPLRYL